MSFGGSGISPHCQDHPAVVGRILDSGAAIFAGLEFAGLFYLARFEGKRPGEASQQFDCPMLSIAAERDRLAAVYICQN
jgi:hypothetical protein